ncbi:hypothetical protein Tco_1042267 [Tanacetum coccineum]|uniref:Uncharacterized protein n=1 Tax=Tanacetum coccineum TaxID=301880 RepID=A0ABQ5GIL7_9ASTR
MARFTSMAMLNVVLLIVIMMAGATKTSAGGVCHDLIPLTPAVCNEDVISNDCWDACHKKFGPTAVPGCEFFPSFPGPKKMACKCFLPC